MISRHLLSLAVLAGLAAATAVPAAAEDASVAKRLAALDLQYEIDGDGDFKIVFGYPDEDRSQIVFVSGASQTVQGITIREISAPAALIEDNDIDGVKALMLLKNSSINKIGSWEIRGDVVYFVAKVIEPMSSADLCTVLETVAATADDMEIELTGSKDDL